MNDGEFASIAVLRRPGEGKNGVWKKIAGGVRSVAAPNKSGATINPCKSGSCRGSRELGN
jgi:hypothetical protein